MVLILQHQAGCIDQSQHGSTGQCSALTPQQVGYPVKLRPVRSLRPSCAPWTASLELQTVGQCTTVTGLLAWFL
jgi:hypothetical protein